MSVTVYWSVSYTIMINQSRREFVKVSGIGFLGVGGVLLLAIFSYVAFIFLRGIFNITAEGWVLLGYVALIFSGIYAIALLINRMIDRYQSAHGEVAKVNVAAFSLTFQAVIIGLCSAMAVRAFYENRFDNIVMWMILVTYNIYHMFKNSRQKLTNG
ncbi:hypothetical protein [Pleionea litopenaei]|uniref:Uncharacterized protein n=1 Tax=Pleionea litopenaei TaxID=3070815 RepID=A0AA51RWE3_9GAMM|nr:hypothetical protein [Pleionea sp. HL-JVS1]WMS89016.1 hypothetical protein Q9312_08890 [Pleionea sp. HL-JVS1]